MFGLDISGDNFPIIAEEILVSNCEKKIIELKKLSLILLYLQLDDNGTINRMMIQVSYVKTFWILLL